MDVFNVDAKWTKNEPIFYRRKRMTLNAQKRRHDTRHNDIITNDTLHATTHRIKTLEDKCCYAECHVFYCYAER
jgi:hypothetical protein